jgi:hypothetical protein
MIRKKVREYSHGQTVANMMEVGKMGNNMEWDVILQSLVRREKVDGMMAQELSGLTTNIICKHRFGYFINNFTNKTTQS